MLNKGLATYITYNLKTDLYDIPASNNIGFCLLSCTYREKLLTRGKYVIFFVLTFEKKNGIELHEFFTYEIYVI